MFGNQSPLCLSSSSSPASSRSFSTRAFRRATHRLRSSTMEDFLLRLFVSREGSLSSTLLLQAKELQTNFVHLSLLSKYYKRAYLDFFLTSDANAGKQSSDANTSGYLTDYHRFGWLLFLALRVHVFSQFKDLVTCTNGLVSIMEDLQNSSTATGEKGDDLIRVLRELTAVRRKIADLQVELQGRKDTMEKAIKNKVAKAVVPAIDVMFQALSEFGAKVVPPKRILKMLPELFDHQDQNVRASSKGLTLELCQNSKLEWLDSLVLSVAM